MEKGQKVSVGAGRTEFWAEWPQKERGKGCVKGRVLDYGGNPKVLRLASLCQEPVLAEWSKQKVTELIRQAASGRV